MKMIIAIVQDEDAGRLVNYLMKNGFSVTKLATTGGFLRSGNTTLLLGVDDEKLPKALESIEHICKSRKQVVNSSLGAMDAAMGLAGGSNIEIMIGGATVFVMPVEDFKKF